MSQINIYKVGECDWIASENEEGAIKVLSDMIGEEDVKEILIYEPVQLLTEEQLATLTMVDTESETDEDGNMKFLGSFRDYLSEMIEDGIAFPTHFASSEW